MKIAFMFSGQGAQYIGMGKEIYDNFQAAKDVFNIANENLGFSISDICFLENEQLNETKYTQPAILTTSIAINEVLKEKGINPEYVLGLSLGEYSALVASGAMEFKETVKLVRNRGEYMTEAVPKGEGAMTAFLGMDKEFVEEVCKEASKYGVCVPANYNAPGQIVIAGNKEAVEKAEQISKEKGGKKTIRLNVSGPFHTSLLENAAVKLEKDLDNINFNEMKIPVITNLTAKEIKEKEDIKNTLVMQVKSPVLWEDSIKYLIEKGVDTFIEVGCGKTLSSFAKKINKEISIYNVENIDSLNKTLELLSI